MFVSYVTVFDRLKEGFVKKALSKFEQSADNKIARGWIERVKPSASLPSRIGTTPLEKRLALYAQSRLWYETVATLVELRRLHPNDPAFKNDWAKLLKSVGMEQT